MVCQPIGSLKLYRALMSLMQNNSLSNFHIQFLRKNLLQLVFILPEAPRSIICVSQACIIILIYVKIFYATLYIRTHHGYIYNVLYMYAMSDRFSIHMSV